MGLETIYYILLGNKYFAWLYENTLQTPDYPIFPIVHGLWCAYLVHISTKGVYCSFVTKLLTSIIMSVIEERFIVIIQDARNQTNEYKLEWFLTSLILEFITVVIACVALHFASGKIPPIVLRILGFLISLPNGAEKIRIFYFTFTYLRGLDPRLLMVLSIGFAFAPEFIEILLRRITHKRAASKYTRKWSLIYGCLILVIAFQFLAGGSILASIPALNNLPHVIIIQTVNFAFPIYYLLMFFKN